MMTQKTASEHKTRHGLLTTPSFSRTFLYVRTTAAATWSRPLCNSCDEGPRVPIDTYARPRNCIIGFRLQYCVRIYKIRKRIPSRRHRRPVRTAARAYYNVTGERDEHVREKRKRGISVALLSAFNRRRLRRASDSSIDYACIPSSFVFGPSPRTSPVPRFHRFSRSTERRSIHHHRRHSIVAYVSDRCC